MQSQPQPPPPPATVLSGGFRAKKQKETSRCALRASRPQSSTWRRPLLFSFLPGLASGRPCSLSTRKHPAAWALCADALAQRVKQVQSSLSFPPSLGPCLKQAGRLWLSIPFCLSKHKRGCTCGCTALQEERVTQRETSSRVVFERCGVQKGTHVVVSLSLSLCVCEARGGDQDKRRKLPSLLFARSES